MWNTTFIAVVATAISLFCGVLAGYALSRLNFKGAALLGTTIFITYLVPQTLLFIPLSEIIRTYSLGDTPWSLILSYPTFLIPFCTWLMMGYFKSVPKELEECARIDGAARWQAMLYIIIPVAVPGILSAMIFAFTLVGTSSSTPSCSCRARSRRPCRSASSRNSCAATCSSGDR